MDDHPEVEGRKKRRRGGSFLPSTVSSYIPLPLGLVKGGENIASTRVFTYGNYPAYYARGYRDVGVDLDGRLRSLVEWGGEKLFSGRTVLDIGCNEGFITLAVAGVLEANRVVGVDIDVLLIENALRNLRKLKIFLSTTLNKATEKEELPADTAELRNRMAAADFAWTSLPSNLSHLQSVVPLSLREEGSIFPFNVEFRAENFVKDSLDVKTMLREESLYDVIIAFSVSKWIHFHFGDDGIRLFFAHVTKILKPGGKFIFEPQSWDSYRKKRRIRPDIKERIPNLVLRPHFFDRLLCSSSHSADPAESEVNSLTKSDSWRGKFRRLHILSPQAAEGMEPATEENDFLLRKSKKVSARPTFDRPVFIYERLAT